MRITKIDTIRVEEVKYVTWVQIYTDSGLVGLGETWYGAQAVEAAIHELFAPTLVGRNPLDIERHWFDMFRLADHWGYGGAETRAISAIDIALWDIAGQAVGKPIYALLGGAFRDRIRVYNTGGGPNFRDNPVPWVEELLDRGITTMKVGVYPPAHEGDRYSLTSEGLKQMVDPIRKIWDAVGNAIEIAIDGHGFWSLHNAIKIAQALEPYNIVWLEEMLSPLNVDAHLRLARKTKIPICLAERLVTRYQYREYIEKGVAEIVMPDLVWTGGISETKKIAILAEMYQTPVCPHDCSGPVNMFACAHICMNVPNAYIMETVRSYYRGWYDRYVEPNIVVVDGHLHAPEGPGLGTRLKAEVRDRPDALVEVSDEPGGDHWMGLHSVFEVADDERGERVVRLRERPRDEKAGGTPPVWER